MTLEKNQLFEQLYGGSSINAQGGTIEDFYNQYDELRRKGGNKTLFTQGNEQMK